MTRQSWADWHIELARLVARRSKDPSTKVGAVIVRPDNTIAGIGYNGFARGVRDDAERLEDRPFKLAATVHAEINAILNAGGPVKGCDLYVTPFPPCSHCANVIVQAGIRRVIVDQRGEIPERWRESMGISTAILTEGGVALVTTNDVLQGHHAPMPLVVIESPFAGDVEANIAYARAAVSDSVHRGEAPIASHLLFTQPGILRDEIPGERDLGMRAGFAWNAKADLVAVYVDRGISSGMQRGIAYARGLGIPVEERSIMAARAAAA